MPKLSSPSHNSPINTLEQSWKAKNGAENMELVWHLLVRNKLHFVNSSKKWIETRVLQIAFIPTNPSFVNTWCCPRLCHSSQGYWQGKVWFFRSLFISTPIYRDYNRGCPHLELGWVFIRCSGGPTEPTRSRASRATSHRWGSWSLEGWTVFVR